MGTKNQNPSKQELSLLVTAVPGPGGRAGLAGLVQGPEGPSACPVFASAGTCCSTTSSSWSTNSLPSAHQSTGHEVAPHKMTPPSTTAPPSPQLRPGHRGLQPGPGCGCGWTVHGGDLGAAQQDSTTGRRACLGGRRGCHRCVSCSSNRVWGTPRREQPRLCSVLLCVPPQEAPAHWTLIPGA